MPTSTMFVRNNQPGPTVLDEEGFQFFRWEGHGDPIGADVLPIPAELADNHNFQRARMLGIFEVIEADAEIQDLLDKSRAAWDRQSARQTGIHLANLGQLPAEEGSVPREFDADTPVQRPKPTVGPGEIPKTLENIVGVTFEDDQAVPKVKKARVVMGPRGSYF
jgi:hypothetical protein